MPSVPCFVILKELVIGPSQLVHGKVVSLSERCPLLAHQLDFRPITVFQFAVQGLEFFSCTESTCWLLNRNCLTVCMAAGLAVTLLKFGPSFCGASSIPFNIQLTLSGMVADLQKAFNMLPRLVVFEIAAHMGLPGYMYWLHGQVL